MSTVLACDLGGTSLRAALVDEAGRILAAQTIVMPVAVDRLGWSEVDPAQWWTSFRAGAEALAAQAPAGFAGVEAIAISAITRTQVFLGRDGRVLRPAILWKDTRADAVLPALLAKLPPDHPERAGLSAFHPLARLWWLAQSEEACARALATVIEPKDYLNMRLTGVIASDPVSMTRLAAAAAPGPDGRSLFMAAGIDSAVLPDLVEPTGIVGQVRPGLEGPMGALAGVPVLAMATDTWASVVGFGAMRPGFGYNISGTTEVLGVISAEPAAAEGLLTVGWGQGISQLGGPSQTGGDALVWLLSLVGRHQGNPKDLGQELEAVLKERRDGDPVLFLPYLQGERTPYWDPALRGALVGLNRRHRAVDLAHAVMEGVAFLNRIVLERAEAATRIRVDELRFGGGGAANPLWCQIKADVLGRPIVVPSGDEHGVIGAAIVAWTALGRFGSLAEAQDALVTPAQHYRPDPARHAGYDRLFTLFREAETALQPISRRLVGWQSLKPGAAQPPAGSIPSKGVAS